MLPHEGVIIPPISLEYLQINQLSWGMGRLLARLLTDGAWMYNVVFGDQNIQSLPKAVLLTKRPKDKRI